MRRLKIVVAYDGTGYNGWQIQSGLRTVQGELEKVFSKVLKEKIRILGSGRTDTGVHALGQVAHFDTTSGLAPSIILKAVNVNLDRSIVVRNVVEVDSNFHARFSATKRQYRYFISMVNLPFFHRYSWFIDKKLDFDIMQKATRLFIGEHDFGAFGSPMVAGGSTVRQVFSFSVKKKRYRIEFVIEANAFLRRMVRNIVAAVVDAGLGRLSLHDIESAINMRANIHLKPAPARGLFLWKVYYD